MNTFFVKVQFKDHETGTIKEGYLINYMIINASISTHILTPAEREARNLPVNVTSVSEMESRVMAMIEVYNEDQPVHMIIPALAIAIKP